MTKQKLLTTTEAAEILGMVPRTLRYHIERGNISAVSDVDSNVHLFEKAEVRRFASERRLAKKEAEKRAKMREKLKASMAKKKASKKAKKGAK